MSNVIVSPNMNLPVPVVGVDPGPDYATNINNSLTIIDQHTHLAGSGVLITPGAININSDLPFQGNNLTLARTIRFQPQSSGFTPGASDIGALYEIVNDLYYNDGTGTQIRITQSGSLAGAAGTITGLPSGTASASYAAGTFTFQSATLTAANVDGASFIFRNNTASSFGLTLSPPNALSADYSLFLPTIPAQTNVMTLDNAGNMGSITYDAVGQNMTFLGANAVAASRTRSIGVNVGLGGVAISGSSGTQHVSGGTPVVITNNGIQIVTSGRPVFVGLAGVAAQQAYIQSQGSLSTITLTNVTNTNASEQRFDVTSGQAFIPPTAFSFIDFSVSGAPGTYTYEAFITSGNANVVNVNLIVYEL